MSKKKFNLIIKNKINNFNKTIKVDSDKSISIRSLLISAISQNISKIKNILESEDVMSTIYCLKKLGIKIIKKNKIYFVYGKGLGGLFAKKYSIKFWEFRNISEIINRNSLNYTKPGT